MSKKYQIAHKRNYYIVPESLPFLILSMIFANLAVYIHVWACAPFIGLTLFVAFFFRNPKPNTPEDKDAFISPGEGKIVKIEEVDENRFLNQKMRRISIFLSPLNVHTNRIPMTGEITQVHYHKGRYFAAYDDKASLENEQNAIIMKNEFGDEFIFIQIAGWLARRIVSYAKIKESWKKGTLFGLIRFGSRIDIYLPLNYEINVKIGDKVKSGESIIARVKK